MTVDVDAFIFDLDGTLLNTLDDLADTANAVLTAWKLPTHPVDAYRFFVGSGMEELMRRCAPEGTDADTLAELSAAVREAYARNWATKTVPYPGIPSMLERLGTTGKPLAVLSNKPHEFTLECVRRFFPGVPFARVQGQSPEFPAKPDPATALAIAAGFGVAPERVLFLGDSSVDMDTATAAGMIVTGALWGFRPESELRAHGARYLLERPEQLFELAGL